MSHRTARLVAALVPEGEPTDAELLTRFATDRDAGAFELLVWRHSGMVLRACRAVLRDRHAAEDATQAVFLALARQAGSVGRSGSAAGWLFRVACRVATRAARRRVAPVLGEDLDALPAPTPAEPDRDAEQAVHEEIARLPESHRVPVLLCFFEGLTHAEASRRLGVPIGTVAGRVARAKEALADRLTRRGFPLVVLAPAGFTITPGFVSATSRAAIAFVARDYTGVSGSALDLVRGELRVAVLKKMLGGTAAIALVVACVCLGFGMAAPPEPSAALAPAPRVAPQPAVPKPPAPVLGKAFAIAPITTDLQRRLIRGADRDSAVLVIVNAPALFKDAKTMDIEALQLTELKKGLQTCRREKGKSVVHSAVHYLTRRDVSPEGMEVLHFVLAGAARAEELATRIPLGADTGHNFAFDFAKYIGPLKEEKGADAAETGVGDERVLAYPVRTPLSRVLTESADGVVDVRTPIACRGDAWLPEDVDRSVRAALGKLKLPKGSRVNFLLNIWERDGKTWERLSRTCTAWAESAGLGWGQMMY